MIQSTGRSPQLPRRSPLSHRSPALRLFGGPVWRGECPAGCLSGARILISDSRCRYQCPCCGTTIEWHKVPVKGQRELERIFREMREPIL
jgi:hypothetical protein